MVQIKDAVLVPKQVKVRKESNYSSVNYSSVSRYILLSQRLRFSKDMINELSIDE